MSPTPGPATDEGVRPSRSAWRPTGASAWSTPTVWRSWRRQNALPTPTTSSSPADGTDAARFEAAIVPRLGEASVSYRGGEVTEVAALVGTPAAQAAVLLRPVSVEATRQASEAGVRMPQKTTFFWPKPRTGPVFRLLDES